MGISNFLGRYRELGHELSGYEETKQSIRANTLRITGEELSTRLEKLGIKTAKIEWLRDGYYTEEVPFSLGASLEYLLGYYTLQEAAAQFPVEVLSPKPGEIVLDMCAAPGGKTSQLAAWMRNQGAIVAVELKRWRVYALENNLERLGVENCIVYFADANTLDYGLLGFDKVLLDAPCSGNYVTDRSWFRKRTITDVEANAKKQRELLTTAIRLLKKDGKLVYTTCSLEPEENELNVQWLTENFPVRLETIWGPGSPAPIEIFGHQLSPEIAKCRRFWPDEMGTQGFFISKVVKI